MATKELKWTYFASCKGSNEWGKGRTFTRPALFSFTTVRLDYFFSRGSPDGSSGTQAHDAAFDRCGHAQQLTVGSGTVTSAFYDAGERTSRGGTTLTCDNNSNMTASLAGFAASYNDCNQATSITGAGGSAQAQGFADIGQHEE
jgi:hypothetical protein